MSFFPLFFDMENRSVLVVGAGNVAARRIQVLEQFGADLTVVSEKALPEIEELAKKGRIRLIREPYAQCRERIWSVSAFFLVLTATGDEAADRMAEADGRASGAFVNVAGDRHCSDFYFPGIVTSGEVTVGIAGTGDDHGKTKKTIAAIRRCLEEKERADGDR